MRQDRCGHEIKQHPKSMPHLSRPLLVSLIAAIALLSLTSCSKKPDSLVLAYAPFESTALIWIAENQNFFSKNDIKITLRKYDSGATALNGMIKGESDMATGISEFPVVSHAFRKEQIRIIASIDKGEFIYLVGRKDRGIENVRDLKGRTVGTTFGTVASFHLGRFLNLNGISMQDISLIDVKTPEDWVGAIVKGEVDAMATAQPYVNTIKKRLGAKATVWPVQSGQQLYGLIITSDEWLKEHPETTIRFLKSIAEAEQFLARHPAESKAIVQNRMKLEAEYMKTVWSQNQFVLSLDESLILAMEDEARWMIDNNLTKEKQIPNFVDYIYEDGLKAVKPEAVNIIK